MVDVASEYRKLLRAPANAQNLIRTVNVVREIARRSSEPEEWDSDKLAFLWYAGPVESPEAMVLRRFGSRDLNNPILREPVAGEDVTRSVVTTLVYGSVAAQKHPTGEEFSFLADALLLLFHQSYFALLPKLEPGKPDAVALLRSYLLLASLYEGQAEFFRINALVKTALGFREEANKDLRAALKLVHSDEHDFMTRLQTLWMSLLSEGMYVEAADLLAEVHPQITKENLEEFGVLIRQTVEAAQAGARSR